MTLKSWKECSNCLWKGEVPNSTKYCPKCGVNDLHLLIVHPLKDKELRKLGW